jgi:hypothetical protein
VVALLLFAADIPSTVILPVELLPIFNVPAVIFPSSVPVIVIFPVVPPKPIVPLSDTTIVVEPVPLLIDPDTVTSFAVRVRELLPVDSAVDASIEKLPPPLASESAVITVAPAVVRFSLKEISPVEVSVKAPAPSILPEVVDMVRSPPAVNVAPAPKSIPVAPVKVRAPALVIDVESTENFPVSVTIDKPLPKLVLPPFDVNELKVESLLEKLTLEALAVVKLIVVALLLFAADIPSTVILLVELLPIFNVPAVILPNSAPVIVILPDAPPKPIVPPSDIAIVVEPVPLVIDPAIFISFAVIPTLLLFVEVIVFPEERVKSPVPFAS